MSPSSSRLLPEDGEIIQSPKHCFLNKTFIEFLDIIHLLVFSGKSLHEEGGRIQPPKRCVLNKNRTMNNVQKPNNCIDIPSSQTSRFYSYPGSRIAAGLFEGEAT
jgi:hypothetical protein